MQTRLSICSVVGCNLCTYNGYVIAIENMGSWLFWLSVGALEHEEYIPQSLPNQKDVWNSLGTAASFYLSNIYSIIIINKRKIILLIHFANRKKIF